MFLSYLYFGCISYCYITCYSAVQLNLNLTFVWVPFTCGAWTNLQFLCVLHSKLMHPNLLCSLVIAHKLHFTHVTDTPRKLACTALHARQGTHVHCTAQTLGHLCVLHHMHARALLCTTLHCTTLHVCMCTALHACQGTRMVNGYYIFVFKSLTDFFHWVSFQAELKLFSMILHLAVPSRIQWHVRVIKICTYYISTSKVMTCEKSGI